MCIHPEYKEWMRREKEELSSREDYLGFVPMHRYWVCNQIGTQ